MKQLTTADLSCLLEFYQTNIPVYIVGNGGILIPLEISNVYKDAKGKALLLDITNNQFKENYQSGKLEICDEFLKKEELNDDDDDDLYHSLKNDRVIMW